MGGGYTSTASRPHVLFGLRLGSARPRSVGSCPGAAPARPGRAVPSSLGGTAPRRRGAEIPTQHRRRIGRRLLLLSPAVAPSAEPIDQSRSGGKHSRATLALLAKHKR